ncbi:hypothetical protein [Phyllobacterium zundukense]|jgi:hypothetical protein|uniref:Uncharacterized protein n=1 Tax=Phyllobacterium zundukense TaxID=1867719 RepID=A0ACD4D8C0_9HYPH|nr:hypothetical protein [Phyllobacterium zundukense]UXN62056.1 hypothetical protein N8E88_18735 [Phyllobacterium zundukense]
MLFDAAFLSRMSFAWHLLLSASNMGPSFIGMYTAYPTGSSAARVGRISDII